jgi:hypothetical protein
MEHDFSLDHSPTPIHVDGMHPKRKPSETKLSGVILRTWLNRARTSGQAHFGKCSNTWMLIFNIGKQQPHTI